MQSGTYTILYVEDQPEAIDLVRLALRRLGCDVHGAADGTQAVELMRSLRPDLVMLDLMLPGWDGWQVRQAMQADELLRGIPVVVVTARVGALSVNGRQPPPADAYIAKPFTLDEIRSVIARLLPRPAPQPCSAS